MVSSSCGLWVSIVLCAFINLSEEVKEGAQIPCSKSDPELNKCLIDASPPLFASFDKEYPEYNRKVRDPMPFGRVESKSGGGSIGLSFTLEDNLLKGMVHCSLKDMNLDLKKKELKLTGLITKLELFTNYEMNGNILILPITGKGKAHITLDNVEIDLHVKWNLVKVNGTRHIKCKHFTYKVRPSKTHFEFENLFNGDKFLEYPEYNRKVRDPMPFGRVESKSGGGSIGLSFTLEDNLLKGMVHCSLKDMNLDLKKKELKLTGLITKLELFTNYEMNGNILILPITGKGKAHITLDNVEIDLHVKWNLVKVNGTRHIKCKHFTYKVRPSKTHFEFENLFNGDKFLGPQMNQFMNDNHKDVVKMFLPAVETALAEHDMQELDDAMAAIPYDTLFLD